MAASGDTVLNREREYAARLKQGDCLYCRPHRVENDRNYARRGVGKPRAKK